jgi:hypothetical protein
VGLNLTADGEETLLTLEHGGQLCLIRVIPAEQMEQPVADQPAQFMHQPMALLPGLATGGVD